MVESINEYGKEDVDQDDMPGSLSRLQASKALHYELESWLLSFVGKSSCPSELVCGQTQFRNRIPWIFSCEAERHRCVASVKHQPSLGSWIFWDVVVYTRIDMTLGPSIFSGKAR